MSTSSLAPAATTLGLWASTATAGSFCLFCENGVDGLPIDTSASGGGGTAVAGAVLVRATANAAAAVATMAVLAARIGTLLLGDDHRSDLVITRGG
jgi:hypothetical protein